MCSAYKLNKQGDNIQPWHTPFPIWNQSVVPCPVLTVASWPAYRFLTRDAAYCLQTHLCFPFLYLIIYFFVSNTVVVHCLLGWSSLDLSWEVECPSLKIESTSHQEGWKESTLFFSVYFSTCFSLASQRRQDVSEEGEDAAEGGMDLGAGIGRKGTVTGREV